MRDEESFSEDLVPLDDKFAEIGTRTSVCMADYEHVEFHRARDLLPKSIWRHLLREGTLAILGGESKAKKSWFGLALSMHAVTSTSFLGIEMDEAGATHRCVEILDFELLESNVMSRFVSMAEKFQDDDPAWRAIWDRIKIRCHRSMLAEAVPWIPYCCATIRDMKRGDLVIVDCLQALPSGDVNDPQAVRSVLSQLQASATDSGTCVVVVDHFNKSTESRGKNRLSGSMAKAATPDAILLLEADGDFIKFSTALRMDPPRDPITLEFRTPSEGFRVVGEDERDERKEAGKARRDAETEKQRMNILFPEPGVWRTKKELAAMAGKTPKTVGDWLKDMTKIETDSEPKEHLFRYVPSPK